MTVLDIKTTCTACGQETAGRLTFDRSMRLADSDGGLVFADGWRCHNCLGEPWSSADMTVDLPSVGSRTSEADRAMRRWFQ